MGLLSGFFLMIPAMQAAESDAVTYQVGAAKIDITPTRPVLLSGYAARKHDLKVEVAHPLFARAVVFGGDDQEPRILVVVDTCGVPESLQRSIAAEVEKRHHIPRGHFTLAATHTHGAPMLTGVLENLLIRDLSAAERAAVDGYTQDLREKVLAVIAEALAQRKPSRLRYGVGEVDFAFNRRRGPVVDHALPVLVVEDLEGQQPHAILTGYACHCVAASNGEQITGDWAGVAAAVIERDFPQVTALVLAGCGGDQNPRDKGGIPAAERQGGELAAEVKRVAQGELQPVDGPLQSKFAEIELPLQELPSEETWQGRAEQPGITGHHAKRNLDRLSQGESLPTKVNYPIQSWAFGEDLTMVFLGGEVVVDYALAIKKEFESDRVWITAYANDVACYIPSERVLKEGGYEGGGAMVWYDQPAHLKPGLEGLILAEVRTQLKAMNRTPVTEATD
ncbi:MAG: neutral/alkaline non-lysosomal ceramidase N-terminal domain-containing protein [Pirellulaceae bacterium]